MSHQYPRIPYGEADFRRIRLNKWLYVDKTRFIRRLEDERYVFLVRPCGFGKSCWVSLLECYYDAHWADEFDMVFGGTDIGRDPTPERHDYVVLRFDFSDLDDSPAPLERRFEARCDAQLRDVLQRHPDLFPREVRERILSPSSINAKLAEISGFARDHDIRLHVLIDEYDSVTNVLPAREHGFYQAFFATLKAAAGDGGVERIFVTGVSPVALNGPTGGFNIGRYVSLEADFNEMLGLTKDEVRGLVELYAAHGELGQDPDAAMARMTEWCGGYRFAARAHTDVYNPDLVFQYLDRLIANRGAPDDPIETDVRVDHGKLRQLVANGNLDLLRAFADGEMEASVVEGFLPEELARRENFISLMHFYGLLSIRGEQEGLPRLGVPNQAAKRVIDGYLRDAREP